MPFTIISAKTLALEPLVSLLLIFHVLCCLPPCDSPNQFFAYYSISYDSNRVQIHSLTATFPRVPLVSSYAKFCASYSTPPCLGRIFAYLVPLFTSPLLTDVYTTYLVDIMMLITMLSLPPPSFPHFPHLSLPECPPQLSRVFISLFLTYMYIVVYNTNIFDQKEMYWGPWMGCRSHHAPLPFIHIMYT